MHHRAMTEVSTLDDRQRAFLAAARTATLATIASDGRPRLVPICFVGRTTEASGETVLYSPIDEKPKASADPRALARLRDLVEEPRATILVDRWSEDWTELAWLRLDVLGALVEPGASAEEDRSVAIAALRAKYPQYRDHALEEAPLLRFTVIRAVGWAADVTGRGTLPRRAAGGSGSSSSPGDSRRR